RTGDYSTTTNFEANTLTFCKQWLTNQKAFEQLTSGSTGKPKTIKITRAQMQLSARLTIEALSLKANDVALVCIDTAYIGGKMMLVRGLEHQLQLIINEPSANPLDGLKQDFDFAAMVPMQFQHALQSSSARINACKAIIIGGASVSDLLAAQITNLKTAIYSTYGMTETVSHIALKRLSSPSQNYYTTIGSIDIYTNNKEQLILKGAITNNKELITNDRAQILSPTTFKWLGRVDNVINSGGVKIQLETVEASIELLFNKLHITNQFFLASKPDAYWGNKLILFIEYPKLLPPETLLSKLKKHLAKFTCPKEIIYVPKFAKTSSGKIDKPTIRTPLLT
ncbi:MAG: AMP-binding protein, partial [Cyclobacteriaceae bacterium]|nr:AMP-binding protein [Cyclobacteriaceae bacterium]